MIDKNVAKDFFKKSDNGFVLLNFTKKNFFHSTVRIFFFKIGLLGLLDDVHKTSLDAYAESKEIKKIDDIYLAVDIVVHSSKSIVEKLHIRNHSLNEESQGTIFFCSENIIRIMKGVEGYECAFFNAVEVI